MKKFYFSSKGQGFYYAANQIDSSDKPFEDHIAYKLIEGGAKILNKECQYKVARIASHKLVKIHLLMDRLAI